MEILERMKNHTIWISKDAEGVTCYGFSRNMEDGTPVEPKECKYYTMTGVGIAVINDNVRLENEK